MKTIEAEIIISASVSRRFEICRKAGLSPEKLDDILKLNRDYGKNTAYIYSLWLEEFDFDKNMILQRIHNRVSDYVYYNMPGTLFKEALKQVKVPLRKFAEEVMKTGGSKYFGSVDELIVEFKNHNKYTKDLIEVEEGGAQ